MGHTYTSPYETAVRAALARLDRYDAAEDDTSRDGDAALALDDIDRILRAAVREAAAEAL